MRDPDRASTSCKSPNRADAGRGQRDGDHRVDGDPPVPSARCAKPNASPRTLRADSLKGSARLRESRESRIAKPRHQWADGCGEANRLAELGDERSRGKAASAKIATLWRTKFWRPDCMRQRCGCTVGFICCTLNIMTCCQVYRASKLCFLLSLSLSASR